MEYKSITAKVNVLFKLSTSELAKILERELRALSKDWWQKYIFDKLSFPQRQAIKEQGINQISQLDFAAILRLFDQNWYELSTRMSLPKHARSWLKELQTIRNKWAHFPAEGIPPSEIYRDLDTLGRFVSISSKNDELLEGIELAKSEVLDEILKLKERKNLNSENIFVDLNANDFQKDTNINLISSRHSQKAKFKVGDVVALKTNPNLLLPIIEVITGESEYRYRVLEDNSFKIYYESQLVEASLPQKEPEPIDLNEFNAYLTSLQLLSPSTSNLFSLRMGRIQFVPYQYRPVLKLIKADRPRLLIADEVGVGKTIEAGLIIKELRARREINSILIICPKPLVAERKWFLEMKRFDESFVSLDGKLLRHCINETYLEGEWPEDYSKVILPFSLFNSDLLFGQNGRYRRKIRGVFDLDPPPKFDLVIVDEAHHLRNTDTYLHQGVRYFCDNAEAVIFLTATPVQLGSADLFILLNMLRPDLIIDQNSFELMAAPNRYINEAVKFCRAGASGWQTEARKQLELAVQTDWGGLFLRNTPSFQNIYDRLKEGEISDKERVALTRSIEELYTFSFLINRTRRRDIGEFTKRKPETVEVKFTDEQKLLHDNLLNIISEILRKFHGDQNIKFMMSTIRRQAASCIHGLGPFLEEMLLGKLNQLELFEALDTEVEIKSDFVDSIRKEISILVEHAKQLHPFDPKLDVFIKVLKDKDRLENNKSLVFSTFRHTLNYLYKHVALSGLRVGLIHGDIPDEERSNLRYRFSLPKEDPDAIDVLLSSEVGCEGLDFQFCDLLINYDLPWNPMRIEQRIGRIDRYGQKSEVIGIVNFVTANTIDAEIYHRCLWRIGVFHHTVGANEEILGEITQELHNIAENLTLTEEERKQKLQELSDIAIRKMLEEQQLEEKQAELFGLFIPKSTWEEELEKLENYWLSARSIENFLNVYLRKRLNSDIVHILGDKPIKTLRLNQEARNILLEDYKKLPKIRERVYREWEKWLKGIKPTLSITFEHNILQDNPHVIHISVLHPFVQQAAKYLEIKEPKYISLEARSDEIPPGDYSFMIYQWYKIGVRQEVILVTISEYEQLNVKLFDLIHTAKTSSQIIKLNSERLNRLEEIHYHKWVNARADHIEENKQIIAQRIRSLMISHGARQRVIEDQLKNATNEKIRIMKQSELARANRDFEERLNELRELSSRADIHAKSVLLGIILIREILNEPY
ncbi:MAG: helicase-related protein [Promethearchaeota archaeon]